MQRMRGGCTQGARSVYWTHREHVTGLVIGLLLMFGFIGCGSEETSPSLVTTPDAVTTARSIAVTVLVLGNDRDAQGSPLMVIEVTQGEHGTVVRNADETVTYTPTAGFDGTDSFTYTARNTQGESATTGVTVTVLPADGLVLRGTLSTVTPIDIPQDQRVYTIVKGINDAGQMVGIRDCGDDVCGFRLPPVPADFGVSRPAPQGINNVGQIVGSYADSACSSFFVPTRGFLFDTNTHAATRLDFPGTSQQCRFPLFPLPDITAPRGINDGGQIVGAVSVNTCCPPQVITTGFLWETGTFTGITVTGATNSKASGINNRGQIVGSFWDTGGVTHGFLWDSGTIATLDVPGARSTEAHGINNRGQIVGSFQDTGGVTHGFLWDNGTMTTFDVPGARSTEAHGINNGGQIVGSFLVPAPGVLTRGYVTTPVDSGPLARFGVE